MSLSHQAKEIRRNRLSHSVSRVTRSVILVALVVASLTILAGTGAAVPVMASGSTGGGVQSLDGGELTTVSSDWTDVRVVGSMGTTPDITDVDDRPPSHVLAAPDSQIVVSDRTAIAAPDSADGHGASPTTLTSGHNAIDTADLSAEPGHEPRGVDGIVSRTATVQPMLPVAGEVRSLDLVPLTGDMVVPLQPDNTVWPWGLTPGVPISPGTAGGVAFGFLLGAGAYAIARPNRVPEPSIEATPADDSHVGHDRDDNELDEDDLVPDEAVVEGLLLRQDGRMRQSAIVSMTDWSKAKVSRLLTAMAEEGRVVKVRMGRENLICLDGWEPDAVKTSFPT